MRALDTVVAAMARGDQRTALSNRDGAIADTVEWILRREDRIVLAAHNGHIQRWPATLPGMRRLSAADTTTVGGRIPAAFRHLYSDLSPLDAYDVIVHLPHVTAAEPDHDGLVNSPHEVQEVFSHWKPQ